MFTPRFIYSNDLRRFIGPMTGEEALLCERLEQQRQTQHRVRAYVADPDGKLTRIIHLYIQWLQWRLSPGSHALISAPTAPYPLPTAYYPQSATHYQTARAPFSYRGQPYPILQCVILDADRISPSRPYWASRLDEMNRNSVAILPTRADSVLIIIGNPYRRRRNRFRHYWHRIRDATRQGEETPYQLIDTADPASALSPKELHPPQRNCSLSTAHLTTGTLDRFPSVTASLHDEEESSFIVIPA